MTDHFPYDPAYRPSMPAFQVSLGRPGYEPTLGPLPAILDTGADATLVPIEHIRKIGAPKVDKGSLRSAWGERKPVFIYAVALQIGSHQFSAIRAVGDEASNKIVIGRNVLNILRVLLDGPQATTTLLGGEERER
jgi:predicted aspartyl protease